MDSLRLDTSFGVLTAQLTPRGVSALSWGESEITPPPLPRELRGLARQLKQELTEYFTRRRRTFSVPLDLEEHTEFRRRVWSRLREIPYGKVATYGDIARDVGCGSPRAVGQACGANPTPILTPCHRVIAANGQLGGWSGAPGMKEELLTLER